MNGDFLSVLWFVLIYIITFVAEGLLECEEFFLGYMLVRIKTNFSESMLAAEKEDTLNASSSARDSFKLHGRLCALKLSFLNCVIDWLYSGYLYLWISSFGIIQLLNLLLLFFASVEIMLYLVNLHSCPRLLKRTAPCKTITTCMVRFKSIGASKSLYLWRKK